MQRTNPSRHHAERTAEVPARTPATRRGLRCIAIIGAALIPWAIGAGTQPATNPAPAFRIDDADPAAASRAMETQLREAEHGLIEARLVLRTGRAVEGILVAKQGRMVTIRAAGLDTEYDLADSVEFEELGSVVSAFDDLRTSTPDDDIQGRIQLVRWLRDRGVYFAALDEAVSITADEPYNPDAQELKRWLESQTQLKIATAISKARNPDTDDDESGEPNLRRKIESFPVLTPEEINLIRVYEIDFADPPRLNIPRDTIERLVDQYGSEQVMPQTPEGQRALLRRDPLTVLDLMFRVQARNLYGEVEVLEDPRSMRLWRKQIHGTWFAGSTGSCASANCHGGQEAGRLYLNNKRTNTDATVYTNFYIADQFRLRDGTPLINYQEPAESPLLQMALPREQSRRPHPNVGRGEGRRGSRFYFRDENDLRFRRAVEWIKSMYNPHPEYPIGYEPPLSESATRMDPDDPMPER